MNVSSLDDHEIGCNEQTCWGQDETKNNNSLIMFVKSLEVQKLENSYYPN